MPIEAKKSHIAVISPFIRNLPASNRPQGGASPPPPVIVSQAIEHPVHLGVIERVLAASGLALALVGAAAVAQPQIFNAPQISFVIVPPRMEEDAPHSHADDDPGKALREVAYKLFEHYLDQSIDEVYDALQKTLEELKKHEDELSSEARRDLDRFPVPEQKGGLHIFHGVSNFLKPYLCGAEFRRLDVKGGAEFGRASIKFLHDNHALPSEVSVLPLVISTLALISKRKLAIWCREEP
jgi:hypothetical protein